MPSANPLNLGGSTILVTGASSGIGREIAILLSQLNAKLVLSGRNLERLEQTRAQLEGRDHRIVAFDLNLLEEIPKWLKDIAAESGPLHGLVHSAGIFTMVPIRVLSAAKAEEMMRVNVSTAIMLARGFRQKGCSNRGAGLIFLSSVAGLVGSAGLAAYSASKAGLMGLTRSLALELAPEGIRVNCIAPGFVKTEMFDRYAESLSAEQLKEREASYPLGFGTPRDVACAAAFLLAGTGRWITGSTLVVDGGCSVALG